ncbi:MAG: acyloxyacyl hydrolase [Alphaproteobacteria bacterium]
MAIALASILAAAGLAAAGGTGAAAQTQPDADGTFDAPPPLPDTPPSDTAPPEAAPSDTASPDAAPSDTAPSDVAPSDVVPSDAAPSDVAPSETAPSDVVPSETAPSEAAPAEGARPLPSGAKPLTLVAPPRTPPAEARAATPAAVPVPPPGWPQDFSFQGPGPYSPYSDMVPTPVAPSPAPYPHPAQPSYYPPTYYQPPAYPAPAPQPAYYPPPGPPPGSEVAQAGPGPVEAAAMEEQAEGAERHPLFGFVSEVRGGYSIHDAGVFGHRKERSNDANLQVLFVSPELLDIIWSPRPHLGVHINNGSDTSQLFAGLTWEWWFFKSFFFDFNFGLAVHDGKIDVESSTRKALGSRVLFREGIDLGWNFYGGHSIAFTVDHVSHGNLLGSRNEGLDTLGGWYSYRF